MHDQVAFGAALRSRRLAAGLSLAQLATAVHYSKGHLSKIESGGKPPNGTLARLCDSILDANGELIRLAGESARSSPVDPDAPGPGAGLWSMRLAPTGDGLFSRSAEPSGSFVDAIPFGPSFGPDRLPLDSPALTTLLWGRFDQARSLGQVVSPALIVPILVGETHMIRSLAQHGTSASSAELWRLAAQYAEFTGWMSQELGDDQQALWWTKVAVSMAARAGDPTLRPYAFVRQADITLHLDDALRTIELADRADADRAATARVRGLAIQRRAQGYALLGAADDCFRALDTSAELLDQASSAGSSKPVLGTTRTPDANGMVRGWCLFDLGRAGEAAEQLEHGFGYFAPDASRARVRHGLRTALAQVVAGDVRRACEIVELLAVELKQVDSATARHDLRLLNREFRRHGGRPQVPAVLALLADLLRGARRTA